MELREEDESLALAQAVLAFAEWQWNGYGNEPDAYTQQVVGNELWSEVSDRVRDITGRRPPAPRFGEPG